MHEVVNPFDLSVIGSVPTADWEEVDAFLARAKELSEDRTAWMKTHQRAAILKKAAAIMEERFEHLAMQVAAEGGKPLIDARVEVARAINGMELCIEELGTLRGTEIPMGNTPAGDGRLAWTSREPIVSICRSTSKRWYSGTGSWYRMTFVLLRGFATARNSCARCAASGLSTMTRSMLGVNTSRSVRITRSDSA